MQNKNKVNGMFSTPRHESHCPLKQSRIQAEQEGKCSCLFSRQLQWERTKENFLPFFQATFHKFSLERKRCKDPFSLRLSKTIVGCGTERSRFMLSLKEKNERKPLNFCFLALNASSSSASLCPLSKIVNKRFFNFFYYFLLSWNCFAERNRSINEIEPVPH